MKTHEEMYEKVLARREEGRAVRKKHRRAIASMAMIVVVAVGGTAIALRPAGNNSYLRDSNTKNYGALQSQTENDVRYSASDESFLAENISYQSAKSNASETKQLTSNRKIIEYVSLTVETKTFDKLIENINAAVKQSGGYIESSEIGGNSFYGTDSRTAEIKIRIPKTKQSEFYDFMGKNSNIVKQAVSTEDVTDQYIDTQSRIKALTLEKETLENLLTKSNNVSDTLTVYEKLTEVIAEIESYQGKLNQMDNLIDYTTFKVYIDEVEKETTVEKQNWFSKTREALLDNFSDIGTGALNFLSFMIAALPYWLLLAVISVAIIFIIRRIKKTKR